MKRILLPIAILAFSFGCSPDKDKVVPNNNTSTSSLRGGEVFRPYIRLGHKPNCSNPLGICIVIPISYGDVDRSTGTWGTTSLQVLEGEVTARLIFDQETATSNGKLPISEDIYLTNAFGYSEFIIKSGEYDVNFSNSEFGEAIVDISVQN